MSSGGLPPLFVPASIPQPRNPAKTKKTLPSFERYLDA